MQIYITHMPVANKDDMTQVQAALVLLSTPQGDHFALHADRQKKKEQMFLFV